MAVTNINMYKHYILKKGKDTIDFVYHTGTKRIVRVANYDPTSIFLYKDLKEVVQQLIKNGWRVCNEHTTMDGN